MMTRRQVTQGAAAALASGGVAQAWSAEQPGAAGIPLGHAEHLVYVWLGGGAAQIDTWDPKAKGDPKTNKPGSYYDSIETAIPGVKLCEHLPRCAALLDRFVLLRTLHHNVIDEHASAVNRMHTGWPVSGSLVYPSFGSVIAYERGAVGDSAPAYVLIGYPSASRGPGFLGAKGGYIYLTDTKSGPQALTRASEIHSDRQLRRENLLSSLRGEFSARSAGNPVVENYDQLVAESLRLAGPEFMSIFNLDGEPDDLRNSYGGEFGQRCLLTRRLLQAGVRVVEVSHNLNFVNGTGWDVHFEGILEQHKLIHELDQALSALVVDLERIGLLDKTLIVVGTEFGRPADFDARGGRGHYGTCFSVAMAGGGLKTGQVVGESDDLAMNPVVRPISVADMIATIYHGMGINLAHELFADDRPVYLTDGGQPIRELFS
jgi:hypothetical protein